MQRLRQLSGLTAVLAGLVGITAVAFNGLRPPAIDRKRAPRPKVGPSAPVQPGALITQGPGPLDEEVELRPGLLSEYRSLAGRDTAPVVRIEAKPAFMWGTSSPHPRLPPGPFEATWTGVVELREAHPVRFGAWLGGEVEVTVDGVAVLQGRGPTPTTWVEAARPLDRPPGRYRIRIRYRSLADTPARLQVCWEGRSFAREPLPATRLKHVPAELPDAVREDELAARGREAVGRLGCARCHAQAFPAVADPPPGPSLADLPARVKQPWLLGWLANPARARPGARMPALFGSDRRGLVERWLVAEYLLQQGSSGKRAADDRPGDHRAGQRGFVGLGCVACHEDPEKPGQAVDPERYPLAGLADRMTRPQLAAFLQGPATRYPDSRMPKLPVPAGTARDIATYLLLWSKPTPLPPASSGVTQDEIEQVLRRLGATDRRAAGAALVREKGCAGCHPGIGEPASASIPIGRAAGCLGGKGASPRFSLDQPTRQAIVAYLKVAGREKYSSPFAEGQRLLRHFKCHRCHQRDGERAAPLEEIGRTMHVPFLARLPFQRTPRLTQATGRFRRDYLLSAVRDGVSGVRPDWYSYRMPSFGSHAGAIVRALAEGDGDLPDEKEPPPAVNSDPTLSALGPVLVGFEGYSCVSCHVWAGQTMGAVEPGTVGPELTSLTSRMRRDWFDRFLDDPLRVYPGTPMPAIFRHNQPALLDSVLHGDAARQKDAIWAYLTQGRKAPSPKPRPAIPIPVPPGAPLVSQVPVRLPDKTLIESVCVLYASHDAVVYDLARVAPANVYTGARLLRQSNMWRSYHLEGTALLPPIVPGTGKSDTITLAGPRRPEPLSSTVLHGYDRLADGVRVRWRWRFASAAVEVEDTLRLQARRLVRHIQLRGLPAGSALEVHVRVPQSGKQVQVEASAGRAVRFTPEPGTGTAGGTISFDLPPAQAPPRTAGPALAVKPGEGQIGPLQRPGYRALLYPRPKTSSGEDLVMPSALAVHPRTGQVFVASMKLGDLFVLRDPHDNGKGARFESYAHGLFQDVFGMLHDGKALYVLHRRNLSRLRDADHCDRVAALEHAVADSYDWAYGLTRDTSGRFLFTFAPHASQKLPGAGSLLRLPAKEGARPEEVAFGFRNPLGWCQGPEGEVFFTDNQGEWVPTNKLCHVVEGRFYGYPNPAQRRHAKRPMGTTAVWVPYGWARSINGVAYDDSGGKFGPFAGQFFLAELMHGGAIIRANVEKVNGVYQGACFPFWGKGLLGPLTLAFDPRGRLFVGAITTPGWMGQPDRGALFRIDFTGKVPFEIQSIHARPEGFRMVFTRPVDAKTAWQAAAYRLEHYRYEYTGAYGSPELDRTRVEVRRVELHADGRTVDLKAPLVKGRVYTVSAAGVRSARGEPLVHPTGAYTLNEVPGR
jgi:glucose/arabinose dehydrogenase/mono/diheme cytochrome c family protein